MKNCNDTIGNQTRNLPACSAVPQINVLLLAPFQGTDIKIRYVLEICFSFLRFYVRAKTTLTYFSLHVNCRIFLSDFQQILIFSRDFSKSFQYQIS